MLEALKEQVLKTNLELVKHGLVVFTWGNASGVDRESGIMAIKPSGVDYGELTADMLVLIDVATGRMVEGGLRPSSDTPTHLALYRAFQSVGGVVHTHSRYATSFAQAKRPIPALGTTHADYFRGAVPVTRPLTKAEIDGDYELETGNVIIETVGPNDPLATPAALVSSHGPFTWGRDAGEAAYHAVVLEEVAAIASLTLSLDPAAETDEALIMKHFLRKHGADAYYGQKR